MPDPSAFDRVSMLAVLENPNKGKGGIVKHSPNYKGFNVEIRPPRWEKKIWIGKLETFELAQYAADALYQYLGLSPFHFEEGVMTLPAITCIGTVTGNPVELSTRERCASYVSAIAKGQNFEPQRDDFKRKVINVVKNPAFPFLAPPRAEVVVLDDDGSDREDEFVLDDDAEKALQMSSHSGSSGVPVAVVQTHVAGPDSVGGPEGVQAYIPSFDFDSNVSENTLRSAGQSINAIVFSIDDCPIEDEKIWIESIDELDYLTAAGTSTPSVASNDGDVCRDGYEISPILDIQLQILRPSSQVAMNSKRQKIGE